MEPGGGWREAAAANGAKEEEKTVAETNQT